MKGFAKWCRRNGRAIFTDEAGAVTIDWVVLTAALCALIIGLFSILNESLYEDAAREIAEQIEDAGELYR